MPTYSYGVKLTDARAAEIIRKAFPKWWQKMLCGKKCWMSVHTVCDALLHARVKCKSESIEKCIEWAYEQE